MKRLNSKGFSVVEGVLIFIALTIVGGTGFYVYSANKNISSGNNGTTIVQRENNDSEDQKSEDEANQDYLIVDEWEVKIPNIPEGNELSYQIDKYDKNLARFISSEQKALGGNCGEFSTSRYSIYKAEAGFKTDDPVLKNRLDEASKQNLDIEINGNTYYILGDFSGGACTENTREGDGISDKEAKANDNLLDSLKGIVKLY